MVYRIAVIPITLSDFDVISLLQAFCTADDKNSTDMVRRAVSLRQLSCSHNIVSKHSQRQNSSCSHDADRWLSLYNVRTKRV